MKTTFQVRHFLQMAPSQTSLRTSDGAVTESSQRPSLVLSRVQTTTAAAMLALSLTVGNAGAQESPQSSQDKGSQETGKSSQVIAILSPSISKLSPTLRASVPSAVPSSPISPEWIKEFQDPNLKPDTVGDWPKNKQDAYIAWKGVRALDATTQTIQQTGKGTDTAEKDGNTKNVGTQELSSSPQIVSAITPSTSTSPSTLGSSGPSVVPSADIPKEWIKEFQDPALKPDTVEDWPKDKRKAYTNFINNQNAQKLALAQTIQETGKALDAANQDGEAENARKLAANQAIDDEIARKLATNQRLTIAEMDAILEHLRLVVSKYNISGVISSNDKVLLIEVLERTDVMYSVIQQEIRKSNIYRVLVQA